MTFNFDRGDYIYILDIGFSSTEFTLLPMLLWVLYGRGYNVTLGFLTFMIKFRKLYLMTSDEFKNNLDKMKNMVDTVV